MNRISNLLIMLVTIAGFDPAMRNPPRIRGAAADRSHLPPSTGNSTASEGDFGVLGVTCIPSEINNMLIPKNPL